MALITTPKGTTSNAYNTVIESDAILSTRRLYAADWDSLDSGEKDAVSIWATRILDMSFIWVGRVTDYHQALSWPRVGVLDREGRIVDFDTIPQIIKDAQAELALVLARKDRSAEPEILGLGFKMVDLDKISVTVDPSAVVGFIPASLQAMLSQYGTIDPQFGSGTSRVVRLRRA